MHELQSPITLAILAAAARGRSSLDGDPGGRLAARAALLDRAAADPEGLYPEIARMEAADEAEFVMRCEVLELLDEVLDGEALAR